MIKNIKAKPFDFKLDTDAVALVVIDMQRDFVEPGGFGESLGNDVTHLQSIIPNTQKLIELFRANNWLVIHTREGHKPDLSDLFDAKRLRGSPGLRIGDQGPMGRILIQGEVGHDIIPELAPIQGELLIDKPGKGAFYGTQLGDILSQNKIKQLVFAGVTTEVCVQTTMREANDRGYECLLIEDCTESYFPEFKKSAMEMIVAQGAIVGWTTSLDELDV